MSEHVPCRMSHDASGPLSSICEEQPSILPLGSGPFARQTQHSSGERPRPSVPYLRTVAYPRLDGTVGFPARNPPLSVFLAGSLLKQPATGHEAEEG